MYARLARRVALCPSRSPRLFSTRPPTTPASATGSAGIRAAAAAAIAAGGPDAPHRLLRLLELATALADKNAKATFIALLDSIAAGASEGSTSDKTRRRAPEPVAASLEDVVRSCPAIADGDHLAEWALYSAQHRGLLEERRAAARAPTAATLREVGDVQPFVSLVARRAAGADCRLRLWAGVRAEDDIAADAMTPDQVWTHSRDAAPTSLGALFIVEVKKPGGLAAAVDQAVNFARRRVAKLFHEADSRGESAHDVSALAAGTDGNEIVLVRVLSGAPADGDFQDAVPCPALKSEPLPLLPGWDFVDAAWMPPAAAPRGFAALARVLRAPLEAFGGGLPLLSLDAEIDTVSVAAPGAVGGAPAAGSVVEFVSLSFSERLGCGGTSDVYAFSPAADPRFANACAKVPRFATSAVEAQFSREASTLRALEALAGDGAAVPRLIVEGRRASKSAPARGSGLRWPLLVLAPAGEPLCAYVDRLVEEAAAAGGAAVRGAAAERELRRAIADRAAACVLRTLQLAHARGLFHCDVRPANLIVEPPPASSMLPPRVLLADWGLSAGAGENVAGRGVCAYAADAVFSQGSCTARAQLDLAGFAFTWLSIAHGGRSCVAPWVAAPVEAYDAVRAHRAAWLQAHAAEAAPVRHLLALPLALRSVVDNWAAYTWPPPA